MEKDGLMGKNRQRRVRMNARQFWAALLALWLLFIFGHSMVPAQISSEESGTLLLILLRLAERLGIDGAWLTEHILRKLAHFAEYGIYGILLLINVKNRRRERRYSRAGWQEKAFPLALAVIGVPFVDETIQLFTPGRSGQIQDVWLDMAGCLAGLLFAELFLSLFERRFRQRRSKNTFFEVS